MAPSTNINSTSDLSDEGNNSLDVGMMIITLLFFWAFVAMTILLVIKDCYRGQRPQQSDSAATALDEGLSEEERMEKQRLERRLWYQYYLKPYILVCRRASNSVQYTYLSLNTV
jgi:hypothetical protein